MRLLVLATEEKRVDTFLEAYMTARSLPATAIRKAHEAVTTPVKIRLE